MQTGSMHPTHEPAYGGDQGGEINRALGRTLNRRNSRIGCPNDICPTNEAAIRPQISVGANVDVDDAATQISSGGGGKAAVLAVFAGRLIGYFVVADQIASVKSSCARQKLTQAQGRAGGDRTSHPRRASRRRLNKT